MPRTDLYEYERQVRALLLAAHEDRWSFEIVAEMAVRATQTVLANRRHAAELESCHD